ncbi:hypothetical protein BO99DRAFT_405214 [Aspergillus violaceofuscus CBS 115571]|uniref:Uncharacterized protein n=1 Tax=Aspergillus violaceofuscus (strain CBS 115571) TaxID=1450538 RepID=A0A2V5GYU2_ASPV1|nr:hypothetical protein BO99DRAFT_405214 [Aspergillus violaceofuscus CBS 115571]
MVKEDYSDKYDYHGMMSTTDLLDIGGPSEKPRDPLRDTLQTEFISILRSGQPDLVMNALTDPRFSSLVGAMPETTFVEAFLLLSPAYFVEPYRDIHRPLHPTAEQSMDIRPLQEIFDEFASKLARIIRLRVSTGQIPGLAEFTHLLACAAAMGDPQMAQSAWQAMQYRKVEPDTQCYNHLMEALIWDGTFTGLRKYRLRVTRFAYKMRKNAPPDSGWSGYGTAARSVLKSVRVVFNEMMAKAIPPDETTFVNMMLASCRTGWVPGIKAVLKAAWNIDVDGLLTASDPSSSSDVYHTDPASALHPTGRLLFAVAHAFGTNNDIRAGLHLVEFIASRYNVPIPEKVWLELFEWTFVLSRPRFGPDAEEQKKVKIKPRFVTQLFDAMTAEPYNVRPTIETRLKVAKLAWDSRILKKYMPQMYAAYEILMETRQRRWEARSAIMASMKRRRLHKSHADWQSQDLANAIHTYDILRLRTAQQTELVRKLARNMLINKLWTGRDNPAWFRTLFPQALEEWRDFLPEDFHLNTRGGVVHFVGKIRWGSRNRYSGRRIPIRRPTPYNDVEPGDEVNYLDDEFFWEALLRLEPNIEPTSASLRRLFEPVLERYRRTEDNQPC